MIRYSAPILLIALLAGCKSSAPTTDPFFGRTIIPPPGTGAATGQYFDPCYQTPPTVTMPTTPMSPATTPVTTPTAQPSVSAVQPYLFNGPANPKSVPRPTSTATPNSPVPPSSTIPPPGTSGSPYSNPPSSTTTPGRMATPPSNTTTPGINSPYSPPAGTPATPPNSGWTAPSSSSSNNRMVTPGRTVSLSPSSSLSSDPTPRPIDSGGNAGTPTARAPIIRTLQPREKKDVNQQRKHVIDIMDLPPAN